MDADVRRRPADSVAFPAVSPTGATSKRASPAELRAVIRHGDEYDSDNTPACAVRMLLAAPAPLSATIEPATAATTRNPATARGHRRRAVIEVSAVVAVARRRSAVVASILRRSARRSCADTISV